MADEQIKYTLDNCRYGERSGEKAMCRNTAAIKNIGPDEYTGTMEMNDGGKTHTTKIKRGVLHKDDTCGKCRYHSKWNNDMRRKQRIEMRKLNEREYKPENCDYHMIFSNGDGDKKKYGCRHDDIIKDMHLKTYFIKGICVGEIITKDPEGLKSFCKGCNCHTEFLNDLMASDMKVTNQQLSPKSSSNYEHRKKWQSFRKTKRHVNIS